MILSATYSPEDNKLRLYASSRLDSETYAKVKAAGFAWAPKQELFVAPAWTPERADLLESLAGEIGDEDTSLVDRAEQRAERFEDYSESRAADADRAHKAVSSIADNIPLGQPILIGHHSEKHARRDAEKIENGMRRAVKMWETSKYWEQRAAGAIAHAKYKELPAVRARRIKTLEAEVRKIERTKAEAQRSLKFWSNPPTDTAKVIEYCNYHDHGGVRLADGSETCSAWSALHGGKATVADVSAQRVPSLARSIERCERWLAHLGFRLTYERAMLAQSGGLVSDRAKFEPGGQVLRRGSWYFVLKVNPQSVTVSGHFATTVSFDEIQDYRPPANAEVAAKVAKLGKLPPLCNYPGEGFKHMTKAELAAEKCRKWSDFPKTGRRAATEKYGAHRVQQTRGTGPFSVVGVYVTDQKRTDPPPPPSGPRPNLDAEKAAREPRTIARPEPTVFDAMKDTLRAGVQVVSAPQLFPTPAALARRVVDLADIQPGQRVLEPSAGTGNLMREMPEGIELVGVEINKSLADRLDGVICADFLSLNGSLGLFDRIVMNPPFERGADIEHIRHAMEHLKLGGRLVAICANGPRQRAAFEPVADSWIDLEPGTFAESGTNVNAAIVVLTK